MTALIMIWAGALLVATGVFLSGAGKYGIGSALTFWGVLLASFGAAKGGQ